MSTRASELWLEEQADAAEIDGEIVYAALTVDLDIDSVVTIHRRQANNARPQGLALEADQPFTISGHTANRMVLWSDTAPEQVEIQVPAGQLTLWNVWRDEGAVHAWIGAAGIRRVELDDADTDFGIRLLASDGHDDSDVDLDVDVLINGAGADAD